MIFVGNDIVEVSRIGHSMENPLFLKRFFTEQEQEYFRRRKFAPEVVAGNFSVKEAFSKSLGTGISGFALKDVEVLRDEQGAPYLNFYGNALKIVLQRKLLFTVSISHTKNYASAVVIAFTEQS